MNISYFQKINNTYKSKSRQETDLYLLNQHINECFDDTIDYHVVKKNGEPFELLIIKDTDNNTFKKKIKSRPSDPFNLGDYIEWNKQTWLITLVDTDDKTYHSGYMYLCTVPLRWQNSSGEIIERWVYSEDFTKYSNGVTGNNTVIIGDNQYGLTLPIDSETKKLKRDMRFPVDFDDSEQPDVYKLTNRKTKLNDNQYFGRGGTMIVTISFDAFNPNDDKKVTMENGQEVWICNYNNSNTHLTQYPSDSNETTDLTAKISGNTNLRNRYKRQYSVSFTDADNNVIDWHNVDFKWNIDSNFDISNLSYENKIDLSVDNEDLAYSGASFLLQVLINDTIASEIKINIVE